MPLNLLKHKSWNVYSEKNRERVERDEELARLEAVEAAKAASWSRQGEKLTELPNVRTSSHANFWEKEEREHLEHERFQQEHKRELDAMKERHGLGPLPWYATSPSKEDNNLDPQLPIKSVKGSSLEDPLAFMNRVLSTKQSQDSKTTASASHKRSHNRVHKHTSHRHRRRKRTEEHKP
ncbi:hypothetical protein SJAG_02544 [Schizosaccharomyces japonicus yFS275]|uniref:CBF1-interacting co-repressor CIR N-terminal domain-containing protein n=1 Tax=Schizosaccharomyces japonicus (strain yFS275 / FY16936) TaxID=402676 RepID=B6K0I8_SCHJY|nr:hypothetical protein SJAG_02544 [Schizosaccharomyces japonicus yFS275]EEB07459.1 hypothetical protein SJAG_02544 [Schizosaccharomyces japonicus yFS275]